MYNVHCVHIVVVPRIQYNNPLHTQTFTLHYVFNYKSVNASYIVDFQEVFVCFLPVPTRAWYRTYLPPITD